MKAVIKESQKGGFDVVAEGKTVIAGASKRLAEFVKKTLNEVK